ncbi:response regulator transcription factor [Ancylothrix sp. C2]|uniref:response regulator n=1 Tax=Ancylothrix sp. D3o TaxID=2953691 RepID=UPI0021BB59AE|nr:response regulator transcription factor [Ancylothrix sp. D3o]MCT7948243.1 response regulator transcription factor [Ancylothrix sp. D3o]
MLASQSLSILLVDDEPFFRKGLQTLLSFYNQSSSAHYNIVGEAASIQQALSLTIQQQPALILLDLELAPDNGLTLLLWLKEKCYQGKVIVLSSHQEDEWVFKAMQAGAKGYVFKDRLATQLPEAIATVMKDQIYLAPEAATGFFRLFQFYTGKSTSAAAAIHLTTREREVLEWLVRGASNEDIATHLYITVATVKAHLTEIFLKLEVKNRTQAIVKSLKLGLVSNDNLWKNQ